MNQDSVHFGPNIGGGHFGGGGFGGGFPIPTPMPYPMPAPGGFGIPPVGLFGLFGEGIGGHGHGHGHGHSHCGHRDRCDDRNWEHVSNQLEAHDTRDAFRDSRNETRERLGDLRASIGERISDSGAATREKLGCVGGELRDFRISTELNFKETRGNIRDLAKELCDLRCDVKGGFTELGHKAETESLKSQLRCKDDKMEAHRFHDAEKIEGLRFRAADERESARFDKLKDLIECRLGETRGVHSHGRDRDDDCGRDRDRRDRRRGDGDININIRDQLGVLANQEQDDRLARRP